VVYFNVRLQCQNFPECLRRTVKILKSPGRCRITLSIVVFWFVTPCSIAVVYQRFGVIYRLHLQGRRVEP
jgi:hypothetical protein